MTEETFVDVTFIPAIGWCITPVSPALGLAGEVNLSWLGGYVGLDISAPTVVTEFVARSTTIGSTVHASTLRALYVIFGPAVEKAVRIKQPGRHAMTFDPSILDRLSELALAELGRMHYNLVSTLPNLDVIHAIQNLGLPVFDSLSLLLAEQCEIAVSALARSAGRDSFIVDQMTVMQRFQLRGRLSSLQNTLTSAEHASNITASLQNLLDLLDDDAVAEVLAHSYASVPVAGYGDSSGTTAVEFRSIPDELHVRLGSIASTIFAGVHAIGELPGTIRVLAYLSPSDPVVAEQLVARVMTWDGKVLGEAPLEFAQSKRGLSSLGAWVDISVYAGDVYVDVSIIGAPSLLSEELLVFATHRAELAGQRAVLARSGVEDDTSARQFASSAKYFRVADEPAKAEAVEMWASRSRTRSDQHWLPALLGHWESRIYGDTRLREPSFDDTLRSVGDFGLAVTSSPALGRVFERMAQELLRSRDPYELEDAHDLQERALQQWVALGDTEAAAIALKTWKAMPLPQSE